MEKEEKSGGRGGDGGIVTGAPCGSSREVLVCVCALRHKGRFRLQDTVLLLNRNLRADDR